MSKEQDEREINSMTVARAIADTLNKAKSPLTDAQLMLLHGAMAVWFDLIVDTARASLANEGVQELEDVLTQDETRQIYAKWQHLGLTAHALYKMLMKEALAKYKAHGG
jgi:hypothetical protein